MDKHPSLNRLASPQTGVAATIAGAAALAGLAAYNVQRARDAERENPPIGEFIEVNGVLLHYFAQGQGRPLLLLHGNGITLLDFLLSGFLQAAAADHRVIAFDRPGFGYSDRPRGTTWSAQAQADLLLRALDRLGIDQPIVLGHSWGASVAMAMGLIAPDRVAGLVLLSGYYFPSARLDAPIFAAPAIPVIGDALRFTISPVVSRMIWPGLVRKIFAPPNVPPRFHAYPRDMSLRPSQLRAAAEESGLMIPDAHAMQDKYRRLRTPLTLVAGESDELVNFQRQSARLHRELPDSKLVRISGVGHMVHYFATNRILQAIQAMEAPRRSSVPAGDLTPEPTLM